MLLLERCEMGRFSSSRRVPVSLRRSPKKANSRTPVFDVQLYLASAGPGRKLEKFRREETVFAQGDPATNVMYIQEGAVNLTVVNEIGREAVVAILGPGDFFGEGCLAGQSICTATARATTPTTVLVTEKDEMIRALHEEYALSDRFIAYLLKRNKRVEEDLIDHLFNSIEKRLARTLLLLAGYGKQNKPEKIVPTVSQEMLAEMIGTTRTRVNLFNEQIQKTGLHRVRQQTASPANQQVPSERRPARLTVRVAKEPPWIEALNLTCRRITRISGTRELFPSHYAR